MFQFLSLLFAGRKLKLEEERFKISGTTVRHEVLVVVQVPRLPQRVHEAAFQGPGEVFQLQDDQQVPGGLVSGLGGQHEEDGGWRSV